MSVVYLDYNATTPLDPRVLEAMMPFLTEHHGNASSQHGPGRVAANAVERARAQVAEALGAEAREIVFTAGATESNNLALKGIARWPSTERRGRHLVTARTEHRAVLDPLESLERDGWEVTRLGVDRDGMIDLDELADSLRDDTVLVSLMHANNETGVLHPICEIGAICRQRGVLLHSDATQAFGREAIDVSGTPVDSISISGHKAHAAKGVGALWLRSRSPRVRCAAVIDGGGHERGLRSGTLNVAGIVSLGAAAEIIHAERAADVARMRALRDALQERLLADVPGAVVVGHRERRLANTLDLAVPGINASALVESLDAVAISSAAACSSATAGPSHVLGAMGFDDDHIRGSLRISLGRFTSENEIETAAEAIGTAIAALH